jgi:hypothetical protein
MKISDEMKENIGVCYVSSLDIDPRVKIQSIRRLLTLLYGASKINNDAEYEKLILHCINECEMARAELAESDENWAHACWICDKILDRVTPMVYSGYGTIKDSSGFSLQGSYSQEVKHE